MEDDLEQRLGEDSSDPWLKRAFREEWPTMANHLVACGASIGASTGCSYAASGCESGAMISGIATTVDAVTYWGVFLSQLLFRDRSKLKDGEGNHSFRRVMRKAGEYLSIIGIFEGAYAALRFYGQYKLQKEGWDPATASMTIQASVMALGTIALPLIRYAYRQRSERP